MVKLLTIRGFAEKYNIGYSTVRNWIAAGRIETVSVGPRMKRIPETEAAKITDWRDPEAGQ